MRCALLLVSQVAAKLTVQAATTAVKVATPVGQWALKEGFKAAVGLVSYAREQDRQSKTRKQKVGQPGPRPTGASTGNGKGAAKSSM